MSEKISQFVIDLGGSDTELRALFSGVKQRLRSDVAELEAIGKKLDLFGGISDSLPQVQRALDSAKSKVTQFAAEIQKIESAGGKAPKALTDALKDAEKATAAATRELARQQQQLTTLGNQLTRAGVDTKNLATEQLRLAEASKVAGVAAEQTAAKQLLGLRTLKDVAPEIAKQRAAFDLLKNSGTLSATEIAAAQKLLDGRIKELTASVTTAGGSFTDMGAAVTPMLLRVASAAAVIGTVGAAFNSVAEAAKAYNNSLAQVGTVTTLSKEQLAALGGDARKLATELGISLPEALKSLYEIIRSGVPANNSIEVLRLSALAAKAAFTDTATGAEAAGVLIDAFGIDVKDLSGALDIVVRSAQTGGPTLVQFAQNAALLGNAARATGADFQEVQAVLNVMTDASNDAAGSAQLLAKILLSLDKPETQAGLRKLGLEGRSLAQTFRGLDERGLKISEFLELGIVNAKAAAAVSALTNNADKLPAALNNAATAAGTLAKATAALYDTPEQRKKRFDAALEETKVKLGESVGASSIFASAMATVFNAINAADDVVQKYNAHISEQNTKVLELAKAHFEIKPAVDTATAAINSFREAAIPTGAAVDKLTADIKKAVDSLPAFAKAISEVAAQQQKAVADQIAALNERASAEIAALDKSVAAQVATADRMVAIQTKLNADVLALIQKSEVDTLRELAAGESARRAIGGKEADIAKDVATLRISTLAPVLAAYSKHYTALLGQAEVYRTTLSNIEAARVSFAESNEAKARTARVAGLTDLQQYAEKSKEADRLIAKGREVAATEGIDAAKKYFQQADTISESIKGEVVRDGLVVISEFQAQQTSIDKIKKSADAYNQALADAKEKAKTGADGTREQLGIVSLAIDGIQTRLDTAKNALAKGFNVKINEEIEGLAAAEQKLDNLVRTREALIRVRTENQGAPGETPSGFAAGGPVLKQVAQQFANGGPVFNRPSWTKVPGSGNGDTVPALLREGSFVVKKSASKMYGDSVMSHLARGYAAGGTVSGSGDWRAAIAYAQSLFPFLRHSIFREVQKAMFDDVQALSRTGGKDESSLKHLLGLSADVAKNYYLKDFWGSNSGRSAAGTKSLPSFEEFMERYNAASTRKFAVGGGVGTDTVRALLTPGETVIAPPAVRSIAARFGPGFLPALNNMRIPAPPIPRFATGGPVGNVPGWKPGGEIKGMGGDITINISATGADFSDPSAVRRLLLPAMRDIQRRTGS